MLQSAARLGERRRDGVGRGEPARVVSIRKTGKEKVERREREQVRASRVHLTLGGTAACGGAGAAAWHGDSARHWRHRDDGAPVLPVQRPVVPVDHNKTEMPFLFG